MSSHEDKIILQKLKGSENYQLWSLKLLAIMADANCDDAVTGKLPRPILLPQDSTETEASFAARQLRYENDTDKWEGQNKKAYAKILLSCEDSIIQFFKHTTVAKEAWDILKATCDTKDAVAPIHYLGQLFQTTLIGSKGCKDYITKIREKWEDINRVGSTSGSTLGEWVPIGILLLNLTDSYDQWRQVRYEAINMQISQGIKPSFDDLARLLLNEEFRQTQTQATSNFIKARASSQNRAKGQNGGGSQADECRTCKEEGRTSNHDHKRCYFKYPELAPERWKAREARKKKE